MTTEPIRLRDGEALLLDFTKGEVSVISLEEMNRRMREQEERGVRMTAGMPAGPGEDADA